MTRLELRFLPSRAKTFPLALRLAQALGGSSSLEGPGGTRINGPEICVRVASDPRSLAALAELWPLVAHRAGTRLLLDGQPIPGVPGWRLAAWLLCLARASTFTPPARYCRSGAVPAAVPLPWLPCRLWAASWPLWVERIDWTDPSRASDQARAALADLGLLHCPLLNWAGFEAMLSARPADRLLSEIFPRAGE